LSTTYKKLRDPFSRIVFREQGAIWDVYWKSPEEIDPPAFKGDKLFATFDLREDDDEILLDVITYLFFGHEEIHKVCHEYSGGIEKGRCLSVYDAHMNDDTLLLSEYGHIMTYKEVRDRCQTIIIKEKY
jgi:hypothetical protein